MNISAWARRYCEIGLALTWTKPGQSGPRHIGWNLAENAIVDPEKAGRFWLRHPGLGIACLLKFSGLVSLDIDEPEYASIVLKALGVDLPELRATVPGVVGRPGRIRLPFRAPDVDLKHRNAKWPVEGNPKESKVLFEFRAGAIADTLPPTIHAKTGLPYSWRVRPIDGEFPPLPRSLLDAWVNWQETERTIRDLCPWAPARPVCGELLIHAAIGS